EDPVLAAGSALDANPALVEGRALAAGPAEAAESGSCHPLAAAPAAARRHQVRPASARTRLDRLSARKARHLRTPRRLTAGSPAAAGPRHTRPAQPVRGRAGSRTGREEPGWRP